MSLRLVFTDRGSYIDPISMPLPIDKGKLSTELYIFSFMEVSMHFLHKEVVF